MTRRAFITLMSGAAAWPLAARAASQKSKIAKFLNSGKFERRETG